MRKQTIRAYFKILFTSLFLICIVGFIFQKPIYNTIRTYLSINKPVRANILLVEGWMSRDIIELAFNEYQRNSYELIVTTGIKNSDYFGMYMNGFLIFHTQGIFNGQDSLMNHRIEINAFSELGGENAAHFDVYINSAFIKSFNAETTKKKFGVEWTGKLSDLDSLLIQFDNDKTGEFGDRNLYIKEIIVDGTFHVPYPNHSSYDIGNLDGKWRITNDFDSFAQLAKNYLLSLGVDSGHIIAIPGKRVSLNRTLSSALAFRDWQKQTSFSIKGINIASEGVHARRTWMTYNKIIKSSYPIGIISLTNDSYTPSRKYRILNMLYEIIGVIYYRIILIPYQLF